MSEVVKLRKANLVEVNELSSGEREELIALGLLSRTGEICKAPRHIYSPGFEAIGKEAITEHQVLNEAYDYGSAFSRGLKIEMDSYTLLFISGTASVDEKGDTVHVGDIKAQCWRTYRNITALLESENASWKDIVKCTCYLRDIERDYDDFNAVRTAFFKWLRLNPLPASVGIQARLCREDLLVEIEAIAMIKKS